MAPRLRRRRTRRPTPDAMTLVEHLAELRRRLVYCAAALALAGVIAFVLYGHILSFLQHPYCQVHHPCVLYVTGPLDGLSVRVKVATFGALFLASPVLFWQLWRFVTPGLKQKEKRYAVPFVAASFSLFALGCVVAYVTFAHALQFLDGIGGKGLQQIYDPISYLNLVVLLMAVFGLMFEFPVLLVGLELARAVTPSQLSSWRRWAIVGITVVAGVITPSSDPFSMLALAIPLYVFYEVSILIGKLLRR